MDCSNDYRIWYKTSITKEAKIEEVKISAVSTDWTELKIFNESKSVILPKIVKRQSLRVNYFETKEEAIEYLTEYWNDRINKALDQVDKAKQVFRDVCNIKL